MISITCCSVLSCYWSFCFLPVLLVHDLWCSVISITCCSVLSCFWSFCFLSVLLVHDLWCSVISITCCSVLTSCWSFCFLPVLLVHDLWCSVISITCCSALNSCWSFCYYHFYLFIVLGSQWFLSLVVLSPCNVLLSFSLQPTWLHPVFVPLIPLFFLCWSFLTCFPHQVGIYIFSLSIWYWDLKYMSFQSYLISIPMPVNCHGSSLRCYELPFQLFSICQSHASTFEHWLKISSQ